MARGEAGPSRWTASGLLLAACALALPLAAQQPRPHPKPLILTLPASVRFAGLGGAATAVSGDAGSVFSNPAGLATIRNIALEGALQRYPDGSIENMGAAAFRLLQFDLGGGYHYLRLSDTSGTKDNLVWTGTAVYRFGILAIGASGKYLSVEDTTGLTNRAMTGDIGLQIAVFDLMALALSVKDVGERALSGGGLELPTHTHLGFTFNFVDPQGNARLLGTVETVWTEKADRRTVVALEAGAVFYGVGIVGRIGSGAPPQGAGQRQTSFGGGVVLSRLRLDYAYQRRTTLGSRVHRFGFRFTL